jgi:hypothetical protein
LTVIYLRGLNSSWIISEVFAAYTQQSSSAHCVYRKMLQGTAVQKWRGNVLLTESTVHDKFGADAHCKDSSSLKKLAHQQVRATLLLHMYLLSCGCYSCGMSCVWRDKHLLNWRIDIYCSCIEYTEELEEQKVAGWRLKYNNNTTACNNYNTQILHTINISSQSQSYVRTHGRAISKSWCRAQIDIITVSQLRSCFCGAHSLTRERVCLCICCWSSPA